MDFFWGWYIDMAQLSAKAKEKTLLAIHSKFK
jgi:hypothetical protein